MLTLCLGLLVFLGVHAVQALAPQWRLQRIAQWGEGGYKGVYSLLSLLGLVLIVWGYGQARLSPVIFWVAPKGLVHLSFVLMWAAMVLLVAAYVPGNHLKRRLGHPMTLGVKVWALGHRLVNGTLADALLFGGFLLWSVLVFRSARRRPAGAAPATPPKLLSTVLVVLIGTAVWVAFIGGLHTWLIGVSPMGRAAG